MLAGDRAAGPHADFHDLAPGLSHVLEVGATTQIKTDQRVKVSISGMKNVRELQVVFRADAIRFRQNLRQARAWHNRILNHDVGTKSADCAERAFARCPEFLSLFFIGSALD